MLPSMNAGVDLVQAYLHLNGFLTITELPVIRAGRRGYEEVTDLDVLAVRFPWAAFTVPRGRPGPDDDLSLQLDTSLVSDQERVDVIIGEVKEGKPRINDTLRTEDALLTALRRVGLGPDEALLPVVEELQRSGESKRDARGGFIVPFRVRLLAFGHGKSGKRGQYSVVSLAHVAGFVENYLDRYHSVLMPSDLPEPVLGILHLLRKLR
ncbi:MAG: hypothetical protein P8188_03245 [Gemmatimonadota bacterium]|jgi:hypothetical protein